MKNELDRFSNFCALYEDMDQISLKSDVDIKYVITTVQNLIMELSKNPKYNKAKRYLIETNATLIRMGMNEQ